MTKHVKARLQAMFNRAVRGLAKQGFRKSATTFGCAYRGSNGRKCAIGHLIPDSKYRVTLEGQAFTANSRVAKVLKVRSPELADALRNLQIVHDFATSPLDMMRRLRSFAVERGFDIPAKLK